MYKRQTWDKLNRLHTNNLILSTGADTLRNMGTTLSMVCPDGWKSQYARHNAAVRGLVPEGRLLEYNVKEGWGPLCRFLGVPEPDSPFPHENKLGEAGNIVDKLHKFRVMERAGDEARRARMVGLVILVALFAGLLRALGVY